MARPGVESLERREQLSVTIAPIGPASVPATKTLFVPVQGTDSAGNPINYTVTSSNSQVQVSVRSSHPYLKISVAGYGDMVFQLFNDLAPTTVSEITGLVNSGFYNGLTFHRVIPNFVIQGGDPKGDGTGGPGFSFADEFNAQAIFDGTGQLAMANSGPNTNGSQFFATVGAQRELDFNYNLFGQLVSGQSVLQAIDNVPTDSNNKPLTPVTITSASIIQDTHDTVLMIQAPAGTGSSTISVTGTDAVDHSSASQTFQASFQPDTTNDPPFLNPVANQTTTVGKPISFTLSSTDLEHDPVVYSATEIDTATNATVQVNGNVVTVTPKAGFTGVLHIQVAVQQQGATTRGSTSDPRDLRTMTVNVVAPNVSIASHGSALSATAGVPRLVAFAGFTATPAGTAADYTAIIDFGDHTSGPGTIVANGQGGYNVVATHTYATSGTFATKVVITGPGQSSSSATGTATVLAQQAAGLSLSIDASPSAVEVGQNLTYTITVTNTGTATAQAVGLSDVLPAGLSFVSATIAPTAAAGGRLVIPLGDIAAGASKTVQVVANAAAAGTFADQAVATASDGRAATGTGTVQVSAAPETAVPHVVDLVRRGRAYDPTRIDLVLSGPIDAATAEDTRNYILFASGRDRRLGTGDDMLDPIVSATYDPTTFTVTLDPLYRLNWFNPSKIVVLSGNRHGMTDPSGQALDGDGDGVAGGAFVANFARGVYMSHPLFQRPAVPVVRVMGESSTTVQGPQLRALFSAPESQASRQAVASLPPSANQRVSTALAQTADEVAQAPDSTEAASFFDLSASQDRHKRRS
jgi:uncharacterized repeat protein (TIGR01451 family)